jgi:hypothetical protein
VQIFSLFCLTLSSQPSVPSQEPSRTQVRQLAWGKVICTVRKTRWVCVCGQDSLKGQRTRKIWMGGLQDKGG